MSNTPLQLWPMPGGIEPRQNKQQSLQRAIRAMPLPPRLYVPVTQPGFALAELCVQVGQRVSKGQVIATGSVETGITAHAPAAGTVSAITEHAVPNASAQPELCVVIDTDASDSSTQVMPALDYLNTDPVTLLQRVADAGICGLGGAGYPTHAKLRAAAGKVHTLILNAVECEPFITTDDALLRERAADVVTGCLVLLQITGAARCLIGIEDDKPQAIAALRQYINDTRLHLRVLPTVYPNGAEKQLIYILAGIEIPSGTLPVDNGFLCHNAGTAHAIARAVVQGEPLLARITTFTGAALQQPGNIDVLTGTPLGAVLAECGLDAQQLSQVISGGSLMGIELPHLDMPVTKTTNCIIATTAAELAPPPPERACIRCGFCSEVCPALLLPQQLFWFARAGDFEQVQRHNLKDCIECGACAYVCPSHIPLVQYYRAAKAEIAEEASKRERADHSRRRFEAHQRRKAEEKRIEDQRRVERAALAQKKKLEATTNTESGAGNAKPSAQDVIAAALARVQAKKAAAAKEKNHEAQQNDAAAPEGDKDR